MIVDRPSAKLLAFACAVLIVFAATCGSPTVSDEAPTIEGLVVARDVRTPTSEGRPTVHVKESPDDRCGIIFSIDPDTDILQRTAGGSVVAAELDDVEVGRDVRAWAPDGIVMESCPGQATAVAIELLRD